VVVIVVKKFSQIGQSKAHDYLRGREGIRCVVLNSCFSERQARMISKHVDCVIGIADEIYDQAASVFATNFYFGLASGFSVKDAYKLGKEQIKLLYIKKSEHDIMDMTQHSKMVKIITKTNIDPSKLFLLRKIIEK
jgi:hypothetical protein